LRDSFAAPRDEPSIDELATRLSTLERKHERHVVYDRLNARAGLDLSPPAAWLLLRLVEQDDGARLRLTDDELRPLLEELRAGLLAEPDRPRLTPAGRAAAAALTEARCDEIRAVLADWQPDQHAEVLELIQRFARTLSKAPPEPTPVPV
jgi:hypothetical protein